MTSQYNNKMENQYSETVINNILEFMCKACAGILDESDIELLDRIPEHIAQKMLFGLNAAKKVKQAVQIANCFGLNKN